MKLSKYILFGIFFLFSSLMVLAQKPTMSPKGDYDPIDFQQIENIVIFIVLPIVFLILYFIWRKKKRNERNNERDNKF